MLSVISLQNGRDGVKYIGLDTMVLMSKTHLFYRCHLSKCLNNIQIKISDYFVAFQQLVNWLYNLTLVIINSECEVKHRFSVNCVFQRNLFLPNFAEIPTTLSQN